MSTRPGGVLRLLVVLGVVALASPASALAGGEPGPTAKLGSVVNDVAAEAGGSVIAVGSNGTSMLVQRVGADGTAGQAFAAGLGVARGVAVQADGKIVVVGKDELGVVHRFNADGSRDLTFGTGGTAQVGDVTANAVAVNAAGQIVVAGSIPGGDAFSRVAIVRLNANGIHDPSFGTGGVATIDLGRNSQAKSVAVQSDGKIVVAGQTIPDLQVVTGLLARVLTNGSLDIGFANNGVYYYADPAKGANSTFNDVAVDGSGRVVGAGADLRQSGSFALFTRFAPTGVLDGTFGVGGLLTAPATVNYAGGDPVGARGVAIAGGGEIVAAGTYADSGLKSSALWAITPGGQLDAAVGSGGRVTTQPGSAKAELNALTVTFDGSLFAGGVASDDLFVPDFGIVSKFNGFGAIGTPPPPPPPPPPPTVAKFTSASLSPRTLRPKTKAKLKFGLNLASQVTLTVEKKLKGRKKGKQSCRKPSSANRGGKSCTYYSKVKGSKKVSGKAGANTVTFTRKFANRNLSAGSYRLTLKNASGDVRRISFTVRSR